MHVGYSEILIILVKSNLTFALGAKKGNLGDPYSICLGQGNLVMGIENWSGAARSVLQDPKQLPLSDFDR